jgi:hypothetical protein
LLKEEEIEAKGPKARIKAAKWGAFLFHVRDKTSVFLVGIRTPDALVGRAFRLIRLTMIR